MINRIKETIPHVAHASTLILFIKALVHDTKKTSGTGSTLSIVLARATSRLARIKNAVSWFHKQSTFVVEYGFCNFSSFVVTVS